MLQCDHLKNFMYKYVHCIELINDGKGSQPAMDKRLQNIENRIQSECALRTLKVVRFDRSTGKIFIVWDYITDPKPEDDLYWKLAAGYLVKKEDGNPWTNTVNNYQRTKN